MRLHFLKKFLTYISIGLIDFLRSRNIFLHSVFENAPICNVPCMCGVHSHLEGEGHPMERKGVEKSDFKSLLKIKNHSDRRDTFQTHSSGKRHPWHGKCPWMSKHYPPPQGPLQRIITRFQNQGASMDATYFHVVNGAPGPRTGPWAGAGVGEGEGEGAAGEGGPEVGPPARHRRPEAQHRLTRLGGRRPERGVHIRHSLWLCCLEAGEIGIGIRLPTLLVENIPHLTPPASVPC